MWRLNRSLLIVAFTAAALSLSAQVEETKGQFTGLIRGGITANQIYGDDIGGYNKLGGTAGLGVYTPIGRSVKFQLELNYSMRGSRKRPNPDKGDLTTFALEPHYIDVPLLFKFKSPIWKFDFEVGLCNGILLFENNRNPDFIIPTGPIFNRYELAFNAGLDVPVNDKWFGNVRFHYSILPAAGNLGFVNNSSILGGALLGGAYNNTISFTICRRLIPRG